MRSVWITVAVLATSSLTIGAAEARSSHGSAGTSRGCLTSAARAILSRIEQKFGRMEIVSTCRPGARIAGTGHISRHASGNAIDFHAGSRKGAVVKWLIANHRGGGTMTYADMSHIHVDIGHHFVSLGSGSRTRVASRHKWSNRMSLGRGQSRSERRHARSRDGYEGRSGEERRENGRRVVHGISEPAA
jgi:hypothetical protein